MAVQQFGGGGAKAIQLNATTLPKTPLDLLAENFAARVASERAIAGPTLAPTDSSNWMVQTKAASEVTNAPIQPYQRKFERIWSTPYYQERYGYLPSEDYYQKEANILASMPYLPRDLDDATAADWAVFDDDRYFTFEVSELPYKEWWHDTDYKAGDLIRIKTMSPKHSIYKAKIDHKSAYEWSKNPLGTDPAKWDLWLLLDPDLKNEYVSGKLYVVNQGAIAPDPVTGVRWLWRNTVDHTATSTFDAAEATNWEKVQPIYMFMFRLSEEAQKLNAYPTHWTREQILFDWGEEQYVWVRNWIRKMADMMNCFRWNILTKKFAEKIYTCRIDEGDGSGLMHRDDISAVPWAPGVGSYIVPPLEALMWVRNGDIICRFKDSGDPGYWVNSTGDSLHTKLSDFDVFGNTRDNLALDTISNVNFPTGKRPLTGLQMDVGSNFARKANVQVIHSDAPLAKLHRRQTDTTHPTHPNRFFIDSYWEDLLEEMHANDWALTPRLKAQNPAVDTDYLRNEYPGYGTMMALFIHEAYGHGNAGIGHDYANATGNTNQKDLHYLQTVEVPRLGYDAKLPWNDYAYNLQLAMVTAVGSYWGIYHLEIYYHILKDRKNRDYFGKYFSKKTGLNLLYAEKGEIV